MTASESPVYIVTGASRGLGANVARRLLSAPISAKVVAVARTEASLAKLTEQFPGQVASVAGDIANFDTGANTVKVAIEKFGRLDGIVFNAAVIHPVASIATTDITEFKKTFDINFFSNITTLKAAIPYLRESKGKVIFVSSIASHEAHYYGWEAYGSSKACVNHLAATLAVEEPDIFCISVDPGVMDSDMQAEIRDEHGHKMKSDHIDYLTKIKEDGSIPSIDPPASVIVNMIIKTPAELNGSYHAFDSATLSPYISA